VGLAREQTGAGWRGGVSVNHGGAFGLRCSQRLPDAKGGVVLKTERRFASSFSAVRLAGALAGWLSAVARSVSTW
jgi:hypothetical protein